MASIIIDGNSMGYAAHRTTRLTVGIMQTQAIFRMVRSIRAIIEEDPGWTPLVLWDGRAAWRKAIYPEYKENRKPKDAQEFAQKQAYKAQSPFIRKALSLLGVRQMLVTSAEADDMAGLLSTKLSAAGKKVKLITGDQDWIQLVNENVSWFDHVFDRSVDMKNFTQFTGYFSRDAFLEGKALIGDTSDNIFGIDRIGETKAARLLAEFGSVANFFEQCDSGKFVPKLVIHKNLNSAEGREIFARNMKLMDLRNVPTPKNQDIQIIAPEYNEDKFRFLCEKLAFVSILRDFDNYMQPFRTFRVAA